jgi:hypothetical protein
MQDGRKASDMADKLSCLRCAGVMEAGFIPNPAKGQLVWYEGEAPKTYRASFMFGRPALTVVTHRCSVCGYLESYAKA